MVVSHRLNYEGKPAVLAQSEDYAFSLKRCSICTCVPLTRWLEKAITVEEFDEFLECRNRRLL